MDNAQAREDELMALESIYTTEEIMLNDNEGTLVIHLELPKNLSITGDLAGIPTGFKHFAETKEDDSQIYPLKHLPPVFLNFFLPIDYPYDGPPTYTLTCSWFQNSFIEKLCKLLDNEWNDTKDVVLFTWVGILSEAWSLLELPDTFPMPKSNSLISEICQYDRERRENIYNQSMHDCKVCFEEVPGKDSLCFSPCEHTYCNNCMKSYFSVLIKSGDVCSLSCPDTDCKSTAIPNQVKVLVSSEEFEKYERLLLQRSIDKMDDVVWCPRKFCQTATLRESDTTMAICSSCSLAFCILCERAWHGVAPCELNNAKHKELIEEWEKSDEGGREALMKRYGRSRVLNIISEYKSTKWLDNNATSCPTCSTSIQKTDGCNKMHCLACQKYFCWLCNVVISNNDPYSHFRPGGDCANRLFEGATTEEEEGDDQYDWIVFEHPERLLGDDGNLDIIQLAEVVFGHEILEYNGAPILYEEDGNEIELGDNDE